jgi:hypothetical protein
MVPGSAVPFVSVRICGAMMTWDFMAKLVMPGLVPGIHVFLFPSKTWMAGTSPAMTKERRACRHSGMSCQHSLSSF